MISDSLLVALKRMLSGRVLESRFATAFPNRTISSVEALRRTLLNARSIACSNSISGVYVSTELFPRLGIAEQVKEKSKRIEGMRVGAAVARGDAEIGFQQISELMPIAGIEYVGPLPAEVQRITTFSAGIVTTRLIKMRLAS